MGVDFGADDEDADIMYYELYHLVAKSSPWSGKT
jgi:hypothetical protein